MMRYTTRVESCFFNARHAGFCETDYKPISRYANIDNTVQVVFAKAKSQDLDSPLTLRFKACGNPFILAAAEWIARQFGKQSDARLHGMSADKWMALLEIPRTEMKTALQINELCTALLLAISTESNSKGAI